MLLIKGIEIESKDVDGRTPLMNAAYYGHVEICKLLLDHGAKIESKCNLGYTPLLLHAKKAIFLSSLFLLLEELI
jgi:ankyrin repeat protein